MRRIPYFVLLMSKRPINGLVRLCGTCRGATPATQQSRETMARRRAGFIKHAGDVGRDRSLLINTVPAPVT
jgi:hypothetical protein